MAPRRPRLRLFPDHSALWPLWADDLSEPEDLGMTHGLMAALQDWQEYFYQHFHYENGWDSPDPRVWFDNRGYELLHWLRAELPDVEIEYHRWATQPTER